MFNPLEFANLSVQLSDDDNYKHLESRTRACLGRAYYSLMLAVRAAIRTAENRDPDDKIERHGDLWRVLEDSGVPKLQALGKRLGELYDARKMADYQLSPPTLKWAKDLADPRFARTNAEVAQDLIGRLPKYDLTPVLGKLP
jgi:hypothetical protein